MTVAIFDIESTGLLPQVLYGNGKMHCVCFQELEDDDSLGSVRTFTSGMYGDWRSLWVHMNSIDTLIGHHIIGYDLPLLKLKYGYEFKGQVIDTLVISRKNYPDRPGGHSVEAWGPRIGMTKMPIDDWTEGNIEDIIKRGESDVQMETQIYFEVMKEVSRNTERCAA